MDMTFKSPVRILINNKFYCTAQEVEIIQEAVQNKVEPGDWYGPIINIKKILPRTDKEKEESKNKGGREEYDEFFRRMSKAIDNPEVHIPVDTQSKEGGHYGR